MQFLPHGMANMVLVAVVVATSQVTERHRVSNCNCFEYHVPSDTMFCRQPSDLTVSLLRCTTTYYLFQCSPIYMPAYGLTMPQRPNNYSNDMEFSQDQCVWSWHGSVGRRSIVGAVVDELVPHNYRTIICGPIQIQNTNYIVNLLAAVRACDNEQDLAQF